ncbi:ankyrin repeat and SOCS box protein 9 [Suricata suricatta]|uniref:Ankyrin repeat and SOCS box containing 9 n=1 Tax=Suricata suricatta TaxID=37032 RepID=A0A673UMK4_SURSU|nr:ankyrin repeat and SOCS box protein 9 [Suricata suricatta]
MDRQPWGGSNKSSPEDSSEGRLLSTVCMRDIVSDWSPMHEAAIHGRLLSLRSLINQGWPVNIITADGVSPLHEASLGGHPSCVNLLIKYGAQVNAVTTDWHTPLFNACIVGSLDCLILLLQHGASPHPVSDLASPIHEAAKRGHVQCVEILLAHGSHINLNILHLGTPLYMACKKQQVACVKKLLESGANVNQGRGRDTPLHAVAKTSNQELALLLLEFGANPWAKNADGKRPVELVPLESPLAQILLEHEGPPSLRQLCRLRIRKCFGPQQHYKINGLFLPEELKRFLLHT